MSHSKARLKPVAAPDLIDSIIPGVALITVDAKEGGGLGSGFAVQVSAAQVRKASGYVVITNAHVVNADKPKILVRFAGGFDQPGELLLTDTMADVAFLRVEAKPGAQLPLRNMETVRLGETVFAVGNPYGFECSVSQGIVSGIERSMPLRDQRDHLWAQSRIHGNMVQTDAKILQGNSGGPIIDDVGRVVGMATLGYAPENAYKHATAINLAVASSTIAKHLKEFFEFGDPFIKRSTIGARVGLHEFTPEEQATWKRRAGAGIVKITNPKGPAAKAGLKSGDVITEFRGEEVDHFHDLQISLDRWSIGSECQVTYVRDGKSFSTTLIPVSERKR